MVECKREGSTILVEIKGITYYGKDLGDSIMFSVENQGDINNIVGHFVGDKVIEVTYNEVRVPKELYNLRVM